MKNEQEKLKEILIQKKWEWKRKKNVKQI